MARLHPRRRIALASALLACGVLLAACPPSHEALEQRWIAQAGFDPRVRFPPREASPSALHFQDVAARLGIDLAPRQAAELADASPEPADERSRVRAALTDYLRSVRGPRPILGPPPPELTAFLAVGRGDLQELAEIFRAEPPRWLRGGVAEPAVAEILFGHLMAHRLFLASALEAAWQEDHGAAAGWLEAAWQLRESLADQPLLVHHILAVGMLRNELSVLLALPEEPPGWRPRLAALAVREQAETALRLEAWRALGILAPLGSYEPERRGLSDLWGGIHSRYEARKIIDSFETGIARLRAADMNTFEPDRFVERQLARVPWWYPSLHMLLPNTWYAYCKAVRAELEAELALQALEVRELLARGDEPARSALAALGAERASSIRGISWHYQASPAGIVIRASHEVAASPHDSQPLVVEVGPAPLR